MWRAVEKVTEDEYIECDEKLEKCRKIIQIEADNKTNLEMVLADCLDRLYEASVEIAELEKCRAETAKEQMKSRGYYD